MQFRKFIFSRGTLLSLIISMLFGILVFLIYFSGYQAMPNNVDRLPVTIVNQDKRSKDVAKQLKKALPYKHVKTGSSLSDAKRDLNKRKTYLIINIPKHFYNNVTNNKKNNLNFYVDESNTQSVVSAMKNTAATVGNNVKDKIVIEQKAISTAKPQLQKLQSEVKKEQQAGLQKVNQQKAAIASVPASQQAQLKAKLEKEVNASQKTAKQKALKQKNVIISSATKEAKKSSNNLKINIKRQNKVKKGLNYSLSPFFSCLAIYVSALLGALVIYGTFAKFAKQIGRFRSFVNFELSIVLISVVGQLVVSGFDSLLIGNVNFVHLWISNALFLFACMNFNSIMIMILGQLGTSINIFFTMLQVVASAGMFPVETMNGFFKFIHYAAPMYYGVSSSMNIINGGPSVAPILGSLAVLSFCLVLVNLCIVTIKKHQNMLDFSELG